MAAKSVVPCVSTSLESKYIIFFLRKISDVLKFVIAGDLSVALLGGPIRWTS